MTRDEALEILDHNWTRLVNPDYTDEELGKAQNMAIEALEEVIERKHGEWSLNIDDWFGDCYKCSACGEEFVLNEGTPKDNGYNYCPNCGSEMRGDTDEQIH